MRHARDSQKQPYYMIKNFEVKDFTTTRYSSSISNILARVKGLVKKAIEDEKYLPKALLLVFDDDILRQSKIFKDHSDEYKVITDYLTQELSRMVKNYKEALPAKTRQEYYPRIIWICPPVNINFANNPLRSLFAESLQSSVENYTNMCCLTLKKIWDEQEGSFYLPLQRRYTPEGLHAYWLSIDASIKFWNRMLADILIKNQKKAEYTFVRKTNEKV